MKTSVIESSKDGILHFLLKEETSTATKIAKALKISPQATRKHLNDLEKEGLIEHDTIQKKIGRPQHIYYLSEKGKNHFPHRYQEFAVSFLDTLTETLGENQLNQVFQKQWERKVAKYSQHLQNKNLKERIAKLVEIRQEEGYMAELFLLDEKRAEIPKFFISEHNCAIKEVADSYPEVCGHELEMFAALFPNCKVERTNWIKNGEHRCGYLIQVDE